MTAENGAESFAIHLDNSSLEKQAEEAARLIEGIGQKAVEEARRIDKALDELPRKIEEQEKTVQSLTEKYNDQKNAIDNLDKQILEHKELLELDRKEVEQAKEEYEKSVQTKGQFAEATKKLKEEVEAGERAMKAEKDAIRDLNLEKQQEKQTLNDINAERQKEADTLKNIQNEYKKTQKEGKDLGRTLTDAVKKHEAELKKIPTIQKQVSDGMKTLGKLSMGYLTIDAANKFIAKSIEVRKELEMTQIQFEGLFGAQAGGELLGGLKNISLDSGVYKLGGLAQAVETLNVYGEKTEEILPMIREFGDVAMGNESKLNALATAFGRLNTQGNLNNLTLRTMIRAGFNPLAEMARTTGKSMQQLNAEMKAGLITTQMVKDALKSATSEGGKYHNMTERLSDSIAGEQQRLTSMISGVYAKWGEEHEDLIKGGYRLAQKFVENYDTIGKAIAVLIATYGTYRAALITVSAVEAATNAHYVTKIRLLRMAAAAQAALNGVMMMNPYVLAATALGGLIAATVAFSKETKVAEAESERVKSRMQEQEEAQRNLKDEIKKNTDAVNDGTKSEGERQEALNELKRLLPSVFEKYSSWIELQKDLAAATAAANEQLAIQNNVTIGNNINHDNSMLSDLKKYRDALNTVGFNGNEVKKLRVDLVKKYPELFGIDPKSEAFKKNPEMFVSVNFEGQGTFQTDINFVNKKIQEVSKSVAGLNEDLAAATGKQWNELLPKKSVEETSKELKRYENLLKQIQQNQSPINLQKRWEKQNQGFMNWSKAHNPTQADIDQMRNETNTIMDPTTGEILTEAELKRRLKEGRTHYNDIVENEKKDFLNESKKAWQEAQKQYDKFRKSKRDTTKYPTEAAWQEEIRRQKEEVEKLKNNYINNGGDPKDDKKNDTKSERDRKAREEADEKIADENRKWEQQQAKLRAEGELLAAQAEIDAMREGATKRLAQLDLNHKKELQKIAEEAEELYDAKVRHEKTLWDAEPGNKGKDFYKAHPYDEKTGIYKGIAPLTSEEKKGVIAKATSENENYKREREEIIKEMLQQYRDYDDQRRDIEKKFTDDIAAMQNIVTDKQRQIQTASNEEQKKQLEDEIAQMQRSIAKATAEKGKALVSHDFEVLKNSPEYIRAFDDLSNTSSETLQDLIQQFEAVKSAAGSSLDPQQLREYMAAINEMSDVLMSRNPFDAMRIAVEELKKAQNDTAAAQKNLRIAKSQLAAVQKGIPIYTKFKNVNGKITPILLTESEAQAKVLQSTKKLNEAKDNEAKAQNKYNKALKTNLQNVDELAEAIEGVGNAIGGTEGQILGIISNVLTFTTTTIDGIKAVTAAGVAALSTMEKASVILTIISAAIQLLNAISGLFKDSHDQYEEFAEKQKEVNQLRDAVNEYRMALIKARQEEANWFASTGLQDLNNQWELSAEAMLQYWQKAREQQAIYENESGDGWLTKAVKWINVAVGNILSLPGRLMAKALNLIGISENSVFGKITEYFGTMMTGGFEATLAKTVGDLTEALEREYEEGTTAAIKNLRIETRASSSGFLGTGIGGHSQRTEDLVEWVKENLGLDLFGEDGMIDTKVAQTVLDKYGDKLVGETKETLEELVELKEEYDKYREELEKYISELYSPLSDNITDALWDWLETGKDVMDSFKKYSSDTFKDIAQEMTKQLVNGLIFDKYKKELAEIYEAYSLAKSTGVNEQDALALLEKGILTATDEFLNTTANEIPVLKKAVQHLQEGFMQRGIDIVGSDSETYTQNASAKSLSGMSEDMGAEMNGRLTSVQIGVYTIVDIIQQQAINITGIANSMAAIHSLMSDLLDLQSEAVDHLAKIVKNTSELPTIRQDIAKIKSNTSALTTKK